MKKLLNLIVATFFFSLAVMAFICAKEDVNHSVALWVMGVVLGLGGVRFMCKD